MSDYRKGTSVHYSGRQEGAIALPTNVRNTISWLQKLNRPPLPESPLECERDCGVAKGKAPAWITSQGKAVRVAWKPYQTSMPSQSDLRKWFEFTKGIGTLGGWNGQHFIGFVDLDPKDSAFESIEAFEIVFTDWLQTYPSIASAPRFKTPSGGYRIIVAFISEPDWTAFSLIEGGTRMGELLTHNGSHTLLPPTVGTNGKAYEWEQWSEYPPVVESPEVVGIYPTRKNHGPSEAFNRTAPAYVPGAIRLEDLGSDRAKAILRGESDGDRSHALAAAANEWYGWENFCQRNGITYSGRTEDLAAYAWSQMPEAEKDPDKWQRVIKTIPANSCQTSAEHVGGDETGCWKKIYKHDRATFEAKCPAHIQSSIRFDFGLNNAPLEVKTPLKSMPEVAESAVGKDDGFDAYMKDIASALALSNPVQREYALARIAPKYHLKAAVVERAVEALTIPRKPPEELKTYFTLDELLNEPAIALQWLIPSFIPKGESILLTAKPKVGKTLLAYKAAFAIASGTRFLGETAERGRVLIIQCEEGKYTLKSRMEAFNFDALESEERKSIRLLTQFDVTRDIDLLEQILEDFRPSLVIMDSLRKISVRCKYDENSAEFAKPVYELSDLARQYGAATIFIHHDRKNPGEKDTQGIDNVAGTSALVGATWGSWRLLRVSNNEDDPNRHLSLTVRGTKGSRHHIKLDEQEGCSFDWEYVQELTADPENKKWQDKIIACLKFYQTAQWPKQALTINDLREYFNLPYGDKTLNKPLNRMIERGLVSCKKDENNKRIRWYSLPSEDGVPSPPQENDHLSNQYGSNPYTESDSNSGQHSRQITFNGGQPQNQANCLPCNSELSTIGNSHPVSNSAIAPHESQKVEGGRVPPSPFREKNGVVHYETKAQPVGKSLPTHFINEVDGFKVGDRVYWVDAPDSVEWMRERSVAVVGVTPGFARVEMQVKPIPMSQLVKESELEGFSVGDSVTVCVDHMDEWSQRDIVKNNEAPVGQVGVVLGFSLNEAALFCKQRMAQVQICLTVDGTIHTLPVDYLRKA